MARPRLTQETRRSAQLRVRLTPDELQRLEAEAEAAQSPFSDYVRERLLTGRVTVRRTTELAPAAWVELRRLGVNLNQIARVLNTAAGDPTARDVVLAKGRDVVRLLTRLDDLLPDGRPDQHAAGSEEGLQTGVRR